MERKYIYTLNKYMSVLTRNESTHRENDKRQMEWLRGEETGRVNIGRIKEDSVCYRPSINIFY